MRHRFLFRILAFLISGTAIGIFLHRSLPHLAGSEGRFSLPATLGISLIVVALQLVNAWKLRLLLSAPSSFRHLYGVCLVSNFFGAALATQIAGDVSKLWILNRSRTGSGGRTLAVVRDRLSSLVAVGLVLLWGLSAQQWPAQMSPPLAAVAFLLAISICAWITPPCERATAQIIRQAAQRFRIPWRVTMEDPPPGARQWLWIHSASLAIQLAGLATISYSFRMLGAHPASYELVLLSTISVAAVILPLTAGGIGVREISSYSVLLHWGYPAPIAAAGVAQLTAGFLLGTAAGGLLGWALLERNVPGKCLAPEAPARIPLS